MAILDDTLFMATVDAHLVAVDARNGEQLWDTKVGEAKAAYAMTLAPLAIKDKVIVGVAGAEYGIRGYIAAYDAQDRQRSLEALHHPRPGRARTRHVARPTAGNTAARRSGRPDPTIPS